MITGEDTVVVVGLADLAPTVGRMLDALGKRLPAMLVSINDGERQHEFSLWRAGTVTMPSSRGDVMVARDSALRDAWDEHGYFTDPKGQGPLTIYHEPCERGLIKIGMREELYRRNPHYGFSPFDALLLGDGCSVLTIVTPDGAPRTHANNLTIFIIGPLSPSSMQQGAVDPSSALFSVALELGITIGLSWWVSRSEHLRFWQPLRGKGRWRDSAHVSLDVTDESNGQPSSSSY